MKRKSAGKRESLDPKALLRMTAKERSKKYWDGECATVKRIDERNGKGCEKNSI